LLIITLITRPHIKEVYAILAFIVVGVPPMLVIGWLFKKGVLVSWWLYISCTLITWFALLAYAIITPTELLAPWWAKILFSAFGTISIMISVIRYFEKWRDKRKS
jgi:hypothetical protein